MDARVRCTRGVQVLGALGRGCQPGPWGQASAVPRCGCHNLLLAGPTVVVATAPLRPLKSGDFLPWFYGLICLRRVLSPVINHLVLGAQGTVAGRMPVAPAPLRGTSQTCTYLGAARGRRKTLGQHKDLHRWSPHLQTATAQPQKGTVGMDS